MANMDYPGPCMSCSAVSGCSTDGDRQAAIEGYCKGIEMELNMWKARLFDVFANAGDIGNGAFNDKFNLIKSTIKEIEMLSKQMEAECPMDISSQESKVGALMGDLRTHYTEALSVISPGYFGG